ncbi:MAG: hypothetical protein R3C11_17605 [Planctomycetaceae bacterium]
MTPEELNLTRKYLQGGGTLLILLGDKTAAGNWNNSFFASDTGFPSLKLQEIKADKQPGRGGIHLDENSLTADWLKSFQAEEQGGLTDALFTRWWSITFPELESDSASSAASQLQILLRLESGDPWLLSGKVGAGQLAILTTPLSTEWTNLPTKPDYVPFLHELIQALINQPSHSRLVAGDPLVFAPEPVEDSESSNAESDYELLLPTGKIVPVQLNDQQKFIYKEANTAGVYTIQNKTKQTPVEYFVLGFEPSESNPALLSDAEIASLQTRYPWEELATWEALQARMLTSTGRTEITTWLLILFVLILLGEQFFTHYLVRDAHRFESLDSPTDEQGEK